MIDLGKNIDIPKTPENNFYLRNDNFTKNFEKNSNDESESIEKREINNLNNNNFIIKENSSYKPYDIFFDYASNKEEKCELENVHFRTTTLQYETINGKKIITSNEMTNNIISEKFHTTEFDKDKVKDMQFLRIKNARRTNEEIEKTKQTSDPRPKKIKKLGRKKNDFKYIYPKDEKIHGKENDDNNIEA